MSFALMPPNRFPSGALKAGFITKTRGAGSSGIAAIISEDVARMMSARLSVGAQSDVTLGR